MFVLMLVASYCIVDLFQGIYHWCNPTFLSVEYRSLYMRCHQENLLTGGDLD